jgi:hypothetical protein
MCNAEGWPKRADPAERACFRASVHAPQTPISPPRRITGSAAGDLGASHLPVLRSALLVALYEEDAEDMTPASPPCRWHGGQGPALIVPSPEQQADSGGPLQCGNVGSSM